MNGVKHRDLPPAEGATACARTRAASVLDADLIISLASSAPSRRFRLIAAAAKGRPQAPAHNKVVFKSAAQGSIGSCEGLALGCSLS